MQKVTRLHDHWICMNEFLLQPLAVYTIFALPGSSGWQNSPTRTGTRTTQLKTRLDAAVAMRVYSISADELCTNHEILHTYLPFYIWSWYIYEMKVHIKYIYYYKFEMKLLLITNKNRKIGRVKVHSHDGQWRGIVMFTPTLRCECAQPMSDRLMRKWCMVIRPIKQIRHQLIIFCHWTCGNSL